MADNAVKIKINFVKRDFLVWLLLCTALLGSGCAAPQNRELYYWGEYEQLIQDSYLEPGSIDTVSWIEKLNTDIQQAAANGRRIPPGLYAQLGYLYASEGNVSLSNEAFGKEMELYPESKIWIEGMLKRATQSKEK